MSEQLIIRVTTGQSDVEVLHIGVKEKFKKIGLQPLIETLNEVAYGRKSKKSRNLKFIVDKDIIAYDHPYYLFYQEDMERFVTFQQKGYKIKFPKCIYLVEIGKVKENFKIHEIKAFAIKEFKEESTELFAYPFPNMLAANRICIGTAVTKIEGNRIHDALETVITTEYSHATFDGINGFRNTVDWFEYLEKNPFPYEYLKPLNRILDDFLTGTD